MAVGTRDRDGPRRKKEKGNKSRRFRTNSRPNSGSRTVCTAVVTAVLIACRKLATAVIPGAPGVMLRSTGGRGSGCLALERERAPRQSRFKTREKKRKSRRKKKEGTHPAHTPSTRAAHRILSSAGATRNTPDADQNLRKERNKETGVFPSLSQEQGRKEREREKERERGVRERSGEKEERDRNEMEREKEGRERGKKEREKRKEREREKKRKRIKDERERKG